MIDRKGLTLSVTAPSTFAPMVSDRRRVEQILLNLLNNAIKFTDAGHVRLTVDFVEGGDAAADAGTDGVRLRVADTGIGIRAADLSTLFQPFRQVDGGLTRLHEGTGLGLAICRRLATLLGGVISVESVWGEGSAFTVTLPLRPRTPTP
jgi:signal transduction histidine kinase